MRWWERQRSRRRRLRWSSPSGAVRHCNAPLNLSAYRFRIADRAAAAGRGKRSGEPRVVDRLVSKAQNSPNRELCFRQYGRSSKALSWRWQTQGNYGNRTENSGQVVLIAWAAVLLMALFSVVLLADWYDNGHLRICLPEDTIGPPTGNYRPPEKTSDLDTPPYWCALQENRAAKSHGLPPPNVSVEYQRTHELDKSNCYSMNSTLRTPYIPKRTSLSNDNKIINLLGDDECPGTYEAIKGSWWSNDILSHVVYRTLLPILSWLTSTLDVRRIAQLPPYTRME